MHRCLTGAVGDVEFESWREMNLVQIGSNEFFPQLIRLAANERHLQSGPYSNQKLGRRDQSSWLDLPLLIEGQLLSQEKRFRAQGCARAEQEKEEKKPVRDQIGDQVKQRIQ